MLGRAGRIHIAQEDGEIWVGGGTVTALVQDRASDGVELLQETEADDSELAKMAQEASVVKLVNEILIEAINEMASDVHVEPSENTLRIRYRIDGRLQTQMLPPEIARFSLAIVSRIKIMSRLNIAEKRLPQDGRIKMRVSGREIDVDEPVQGEDQVGQVVV